MDLRREDLKRTARAPAKLNLLLDLLGRRDDGFHELETVMVPIRLADTISFTPASPDDAAAGEICLEVQDVRGASSAPIPTGPDNLVVRALQLLKERSGCELGARVELVKRVPSEAGLGGGSSDAAAALRLANRGWKIHWDAERLAAVAAEIGSDVPFFLENGTAICRGRGERIERLPPAAPLDFVVVKPPVGFSTRDVYLAYAELPDQAKLTREIKDGAVQFVSKLARRELAAVGAQMRNALQMAASLLSPWVDKIRMAFEQLDVLGHQLSGSGSAYFGICRHPQHARRLANILRTRQLGHVFTTRSCH
jgi:4-diphosphocytidyl-2-C-methyl-D-erythritol kinase